MRPAPARNDPCPCGSGKKYKHCCLPRDEERRAALALVHGAPDAVEALRPGEVPPPAGTPWEADLVPLPASIGDHPDARPVALLVAAGPVVVHLEILPSVPAEPEAVAGLLDKTIRTLAERWGALPPAVRVRHPAVAEALRRRASLGATKISARRTLPALDPAAQSLLESLGFPHGARPVTASAATWRAWHLGDATIAGLFHTAAAFYRAAPWRHVLNEQYLLAETPRGTSWTAVVLGNGGNELGLAVYSSVQDLARQLDARDERHALRATRDPMIAVVFSSRDELPPSMRKEILAAGWEIADPRGYPTLITCNTPGGGITEPQAGDLIALLGAVPRFVVEHRVVLLSRSAPARPLTWRDAETGVVLRYDGTFLDAGTELWPAPETLAPALSGGPGADPEAPLRPAPLPEIERRHAAMLERFDRWSRQGRRAAKVADRDRRHAETLLDFLTGWAVPVTACTELDLRLFLYDWFPRKVRTTRADARALPAALARFFEFLDGEGVACPWAAAVLGDRERFENQLAAFPDGFWWDADVQEWQGAAYEDMDARVLLPDRGLAGGRQWGREMGIVEAELHRELGRRWLLWRDEVIAGGVTDPTAVRAEVVRRQRAWEAAPHAAHGGATPSEAVRREQRASARARPR